MGREQSSACIYSRPGPRHAAASGSYYGIPILVHVGSVGI